MSTPTFKPLGTHLLVELLPAPPRPSGVELVQFGPDAPTARRARIIALGGAYFVGDRALYPELIAAFQGGLTILVDTGHLPLPRDLKTIIVKQDDVLGVDYPESPAP